MMSVKLKLYQKTRDKVIELSVWMYEGECWDVIGCIACRPFIFVAENPCFISELLKLRSTDRLAFNVIILLLLVTLLHSYFASSL